MDGYDRAEICKLVRIYIQSQLVGIYIQSQLVGIYIQSQLEDNIGKSDYGLYRDDGVIPLSRSNQKCFVKVLKDIGFNVEIKTNLKVTDFLDVTFTLLNGTYSPYKKPNDQLSYVHTSSDHPPQITKILAESINERLSKNSPNREIFTTSK